MNDDFDLTDEQWWEFLRLLRESEDARRCEIIADLLRNA